MTWLGKLQRLSTIAIFASVLTSGCIEEPSCSDMYIFALDASQITEIQITERFDDSSSPPREPLAPVTDQAAIRDILRTLQDPGARWVAPIVGVPIGRVRISIKSGAENVGSVGIGETFAESQGCDYFFIRSISVKERDSILGKLGTSWPRSQLEN